MDADQLFVQTLKDLAARSAPGATEYDLLQTAALLRRLLLDGSASLVHQVNRTRRQEVRYRANRRAPPSDPAPTFWAIQDGFDPDTAVPGLSHPEALDLDQLLNAPLMLMGGQILSVREVIRYVANVAGGVHLGLPRTPKEQALASVGATIRLGGQSPEVRSLLAVARVVSKGLAPLVMLVEASPPP